MISKTKELERSVPYWQEEILWQFYQYKAKVLCRARKVDCVQITKYFKELKFKSFVTLHHEKRSWRRQVSMVISLCKELCPGVKVVWKKYISDILCIH